jgi:hypothetical protein
MKENPLSDCLLSVVLFIGGVLLIIILTGFVTGVVYLIIKHILGV